PCIIGLQIQRFEQLFFVVNIHELLACPLTRQHIWLLREKPITVFHPQHKTLLLSAYNHMLYLGTRCNVNIRCDGLTISAGGGQLVHRHRITTSICAQSDEVINATAYYRIIKSITTFEMRTFQIMPMALAAT